MERPRRIVGEVPLEELHEAEWKQCERPAERDQDRAARRGVESQVSRRGARRAPPLHRVDRGAPQREEESWEDEVGRRPAVPIGVGERRRDVRPIPRIVDEDHRGDRGPADDRSPRSAPPIVGVQRRPRAAPRDLPSGNIPNESARLGARPSAKTECHATSSGPWEGGGSRPPRARDKVGLGHELADEPLRAAELALERGVAVAVEGAEQRCGRAPQPLSQQRARSRLRSASHPVSPIVGHTRRRAGAAPRRGGRPRRRRGRSSRGSARRSAPGPHEAPHEAHERGFLVIAPHSGKVASAKASEATARRGLRCQSRSHSEPKENRIRSERSRRIEGDPAQLRVEIAGAEPVVGIGVELLDLARIVGVDAHPRRGEPARPGEARGHRGAEAPARARSKRTSVRAIAARWIPKYRAQPPRRTIGLAAAKRASISRGAGVSGCRSTAAPNRTPDARGCKPPAAANLGVRHRFSAIGEAGERALHDRPLLFGVDARRAGGWLGLAARDTNDINRFGPAIARMWGG